ncbi:MAG: cell division protein FtsZ [Mucilaginibacter polytrichastri]|nr:cell division protein FtsZ [Mucilaginibacter polytrichastri]
MQFEMLKDQSSIIKVIGVGGGGGNAVNHMYRQGIKGVDFIICNTDAQALELSPIPNKVQLGSSLTEGRGAGSIPEVGKNSAIENIDDIKAMLGRQTKMVFITAGMGGGTGTGASPIIAKAARELGILTVGIVTTPFSFEGKRRKQQAEQGLTELKQNVDSYIVISNDRLREMFGNLTLTSAFGQADNILTTAAKGIAEIITIAGSMNVDFEDVKTVMRDSGVCIMGSHSADGDDRALKAAQGALASPLLNDSQIEGARYILLNISTGTSEVLMDEVTIITDYIQDQAGLTADLIWGYCFDETLEDKVSVTVIATGFQTSDQRDQQEKEKPKKFNLEEKPLIKPVNELVQPVRTNEPKPAPAIAPEAEEKAEVKTAQRSQADLFATEKAEQEEPVENTVRHQLFDEKPKQEEPETTHDMQLKTVEPELHFEEEEMPEPVAVVAEVAVPEPEAKAPNPDENKNDDTISEQLNKAKERIARLRELSLKLRNPSGMQELHDVPAYKRKEIALQQTPHSSESEVSRFTLLTDEEGKTEIRGNNSFLHDNVD